MSRRGQENVLAAVLLCVFGGYIAMSLGFGPRARFVPLPIAAAGLACLVAQVVRQNLRRDDEPGDAGPFTAFDGSGDALPAQAAAAPVGQTQDGLRSTGRRELAAIGIVALFVGLNTALGPVPAAFLFCAGYLSLSRHYAVWKAVVFAGVFVTVIYLLFVVGLEVQLYHGLLEPLIERF
ncbi:MAG: tripartite tricarboxylate transporter TctB family protein [Acidobacteriota bacterium]